jgi:S-methylmethionine-dependent homocysteine/selenocysteine methylase
LFNFTIKIKIKSTYLEEEKAQCYVAASIGPYGAVLSDGSEFNGWYTDSMTIEVFYFSFFLRVNYCFLFSNSKIGIDLVWQY